MKIQILMSAYNGSQYIKTQLDSIAAQSSYGGILLDGNSGQTPMPKRKEESSHEDEGMELSLLVRDDGSADGTIAILNDYCCRFPWINYYGGSNIGVRASFLELIQKADTDADYYARADQDDEWLPGKLGRAVQCLRRLEVPSEIPQLYCSAKHIVDQDMKPCPSAIRQQVLHPSFGNALVENICTGCTAVFNKALLDLIMKYPVKTPQEMIMHDWWLYLTAGCFGHVFFDKEAYILYRQHGDNAFGARLSQRDLLMYRLRELRKPRGEIFRQVSLFLETYAGLLALTQYHENYQLAANLLTGRDSVCARFRLAASPLYFRQKWTDDLIFRAILLIGKL